jgi:hypothetical protein
MGRRTSDRRKTPPAYRVTLHHAVDEPTVFVEWHSHTYYRTVDGAKNYAERTVDEPRYAAAVWIRPIYTNDTAGPWSLLMTGRLGPVADDVGLDWTHAPEPEWMR